MGNEGIYSVGKDLAKQNTTFCKTESFTSTSRDGLTYGDARENLQAGMTLHLPVMCSKHGSFVGKLLARHLQNPLVHPFKLESSHSLTFIPYN